QKDLGVTYTMADYDRAVKEKAKIEVNNPSDLCLTCSFKTEGSQKVDLTLSNAETSAIQNFSNSTKGPIKNIQIKFSGKETEASFVTDFTYQGIEIKYPVYVKGNFWNTGSKSFYISVEKLEAGNLSIPGSLKKRAEREFMSYVNNILSGIDGLSVEKVEINNGSVNFVGDIPTKAYGF
ncbi:hypothetical protein KKG52_02410, partial [Patescibacteria group bacterium]|nr:hypothetical protein [Patescibacteria group bacterium]